MGCVEQQRCGTLGTHRWCALRVQKCICAIAHCTCVCAHTSPDCVKKEFDACVLRGTRDGHWVWWQRTRQKGDEDGFPSRSGALRVALHAPLACPALSPPAILLSLLLPSPPLLAPACASLPLSLPFPPITQTNLAAILRFPTLTLPAFPILCLNLCQGCARALSLNLPVLRVSVSHLHPLCLLLHLPPWTAAVPHTSKAGRSTGGWHSGMQQASHPPLQSTLKAPPLALLPSAGSTSTGTPRACARWPKPLRSPRAWRRAARPRTRLRSARASSPRRHQATWRASTGSGMCPCPAAPAAPAAAQVAVVQRRRL